MWTKDELLYLKINYGIKPMKDIAKTLNKTRYSINQQIKKHKLKKQPVQTEYAIYYDDTFMFTGTAEECAKELGVSTSSINFYASPAHKKRVAKQTGEREANKVIAVNLGTYPVNEEEYYETLKQIKLPTGR